ncbi:deoxyribose-phosphate aldolase [Rhizobiaceae bacterium]|nr:deoxyribose-phosphate aldolase [Rhizobiaceae bacterium]
MTPEHRRQTAERSLPLLDLTDLGDASSLDTATTLCERAITPHGTVGAVCIWPRYVSHARDLLAGRVPIATVVNFPGGNQQIDITEVETRQAFADGAAEIDLVMPYGAFLEGDEATARKMIEAVRAACGKGTLLKVIIEAGELKTDEAIVAASHLAIEAGADFIKTSTGKVAVNATPHTADLMIQAIHDAGKPVGFKPAGGIKTVADAAAYLAIADRVMGIEWASPATLRFGASSLLDDLLAALAGDDEVRGTGY